MRMGTQQQHNNQDRYVNEVDPHGLYCVQSGVLPRKLGHKLLLSLSAQSDYVRKSWKK